jgi:hypothetical protein
MNYSSKTNSNNLLVLLSVLLIGSLFSFFRTYFEFSTDFEIKSLTVFLLVISIIVASFTFHHGEKNGLNIGARLVTSLMVGSAIITLWLVLIWYLLFYKGGEIEYYIPLWVCSQEARQVIQELGIQKVHNCKTEDVSFRNEKAKLVSIDHDLAACFRKCVYNFRQAIVLDAEVIEITPKPD